MTRNGQVFFWLKFKYMKSCSNSWINNYDEEEFKSDFMDKIFNNNEERNMMTLIEKTFEQYDIHIVMQKEEGGKWLIKYTSRYGKTC